MGSNNLSKFTFTACFLALIISCAQTDESSMTTNDPLRIGINPNYPPFEMKDTLNQELTGFDIDLIRLICERNGWSHEFVEMSFRELIPALVTGDVDMAISAITITPEREALVAFSDPYYLSGQTIAVPFDDTVTTSLDDLQGKRVGVQAGTIGDGIARAIDGVHVFPYENVTEALAELSRGRLDAVVNDYPMTRIYIDNHGGLRTIGMTLNAEYYGIAFCRGSEDLIKLVDSTLAQLTGDNTHDSLHLKWFGFPIMGVPGVDSADAES